MISRVIASQHAEAITQLREAARDTLEDSSEWRALRRRVMTERREAHRRFLGELARTSGVDLAAIAKAAAGDRDRLKQDAIKTVESLEARALERARAQVFDARRVPHIGFGDHFPTQPGETALMFRQPVA